MIDRDKLREIIDYYHNFVNNPAEDTWKVYHKACSDLCPGTFLHCVLTALVQALDFSGRLTVDKLYDTIFVSELWRKNED